LYHKCRKLNQWDFAAFYRIPCQKFMVIYFLLLPADKQNMVFRQKMVIFYGKSGQNLDLQIIKNANQLII